MSWYLLGILSEEYANSIRYDQNKFEQFIEDCYEMCNYNLPEKFDEFMQGQNDRYYL